MANVVLVGMELTDSLSLRYLTPLIRRNGHTTELISFDSRSKIEKVGRQALSLKPDLIGLSMIFSHRASEYIDLAHHLRQKGYGGHITAGGFFAHFNSHRLLRDCRALDSVVYGEGELTIADLADNLDCPEVVKGICLRMASGSMDTPPRPPVVDLDSLPFPDHQLPPRTFLGIRESNILSSRGCWANCHFCSIHAWLKDIKAPAMRRRSPSNIATEISYLYHVHGARVFYFIDDNFLGPNLEFNIQYLKDLHSEFRKSGLDDIAIGVKCRSDCVNEDVLDMLMEMGLIRIFLGIESFADSALQQIGKGTTADTNIRALEILQQYDIHITYNILMFNPDTTLHEVLQNLKLIERFVAIPMNFSRTEVYQGTTLERQLLETHRLEGDYLSYDYRISDSLTQAFFEIVGESFFERNFGKRRLNELAMQLDYGKRILSRFYAESTPDGLLSDVDVFIQSLNHNTISHLYDMAQRLQTIPAVSEREIHIMARDARRRVERDNSRFWKYGTHLWERMTTVPGGTRIGSANRTGQEVGSALSEILRLPRVATQRFASQSRYVVRTAPTLRRLLYRALGQQPSILFYQDDMLANKGFRDLSSPRYSPPNRPEPPDGPKWWWLVIIGAVIVILIIIAVSDH